VRRARAVILESILSVRVVRLVWML
jgi:hypothetical protein